jgi:hypothetical protein
MRTLYSEYTVSKEGKRGRTEREREGEPREKERENRERKKERERLTRAVTRSRITAASTTMGHAHQHFIRLLHNVSARNRLEGGNQTHTAVLCFPGGIIENFGLICLLLAGSQLQDFFRGIKALARDRSTERGRSGSRKTSTRP